MRKYTHLGRVVRCEEYVETDVDSQTGKDEDTPGQKADFIIYS